MDANRIYQKLTHISLLFTIVALSLLTFGCGPNSDPETSSGRSTLLTCSEIHSASLINNADISGGRRFQLQLKDKDNNGLNNHSGCLSIVDEDNQTLQFKSRKIDNNAGATLIVAQWSADAVLESRALIDELVRIRPSEEKIAVWAWSDSLQQIVAPTLDRTRIHSQLNTTWHSDPSIPITAEQAVQQAGKKWAELSQGSLAGPRSIVFIAPNLNLEELPKSPTNIEDYWIVANDAASSNRSWQSEASVETIATSISKRLDEVSTQGSALVGICDSGTKKTLSINANNSELLKINLSSLASEQESIPCDNEKIINYQPEQLPIIKIQFSEEQRLTYETLVTNRDKSKFSASIQLSADQGWSEVSAKLHGQSSLACERKSLALNLKGNQQRKISGSFEFSDVTGDELYLISMCLDDHYINQINGNRLMQQIFAWTLPTTLVELQIDEQSHGVYLLIENREEVFKRELTGLDSVVRRRTDSLDHQADVAWSKDNKSDALIRYEEFLENILASDEQQLPGILNDSMDLEQYLRWVALMSLLQNGDYIDEVFFIATDSVDQFHNTTAFFHINGWDTDDLFSACHYEGQYAFNDPNGLLYCAESKLDHKIFSNDAVYASYVEILAELIDKITPDIFSRITDTTSDELLKILGRDNAHLAMTEMIETSPASSNYSVMAEEIRGATSVLQNRFTERRELLQQRIGRWKRLTRNIQFELEHPARLPNNIEVPIIIKAIDSNGNVDQSSSGWLDLAFNQAGNTQHKAILMRRGVGSITTEWPGDQVTLEIINEPSENSVLTHQDAVPIEFSGELEPSELLWRNGSLIHILDDIVIPAGQTLQIEPGVTVLLDDRTNIQIQGSLTALGTQEQPILFSAISKNQPWGGLILDQASARLNHVIAVNGGGDATESFGHSDSQPMLYAKNSNIEIGNSVFQDATGKALGGSGGEWTVSNTLVTRTDTGAEFVNASVDIVDSYFFDFPHLNSSPRDDDNDAIYLKSEPEYLNSSNYSLERVTLISGADDGIDHNGSNVEITESWIEGFHNECVAASSGGLLKIQDTAIMKCEQGLEAGWGHPAIQAKNLLVTQCDVGLRFGDEYSLTTTGSIDISDSIIFGNKDHAIRNWMNSSNSASPGAIHTDHSIVDVDEIESGANNLIAKPQLNFDLLLSDLSQGQSISSDGSRPGLITPRQR